MHLGMQQPRRDESLVVTASKLANERLGLVLVDDQLHRRRGVQVADRHRGLRPPAKVVHDLLARLPSAPARDRTQAGWRATGNAHLPARRKLGEWIRVGRDDHGRDLAVVRHLDARFASHEP